MPQCLQFLSILMGKTSKMQVASLSENQLAVSIVFMLISDTLS